MISDNLCLLRKISGYTQKQVAEYFDVSITEVTQYESGVRVVPADIVSKLALLFNVEDHQLYQEELVKDDIFSYFTFCTDELQPQDLKSISEFKKIIINYYHLSNILGC